MGNEFFHDNRIGPAPAPATSGGEPWKILVVDDDVEVHSVTRLILGKVRWQARGLSLIGAHSAAEARPLLAGHPDIAVILLDVVMETDNAGLELVQYIRAELGNKNVRIILRTGQPGQAPENSVIADFDINDYKEKTELTSQKLTTTVIAALRSYRDVVDLDTSRRGLAQIIESSNSLFRIRRFDAFAAGVLHMLADFVPGLAAALVAQSQDRGPPALIVGTGPFAEGLGDAMPRLIEALAAGRHILGEQPVFYLPVADGVEVGIHLRLTRGLSDIERTLLITLISKIEVGFCNVYHHEQLVAVNEQLEARVDERTQLLAASNRELERANHALTRLAVLDPLTEIFNRRHFISLANAEIIRARRMQRPFTLILFDIDFFKRVNDTYGHQAGDTALKAFVNVCRRYLREIDIMARYGGEEFILLLPETVISDALGIAERLRGAMEGTTVIHNTLSFAITVSMGVAQWLPGQTIDDVVSRADAALYLAKDGGRNRVVSAEPEECG